MKGLGDSSGPVVICEVSVQNESLAQLQAEGHAWFAMPGVKVRLNNKLCIVVLDTMSICTNEIHEQRLA